jgi:hypothetical protein
MSTTTLSPLEAEVLKIIEEGFSDYKEVIQAPAETEAPYVPQVHLLPQFKGLKYLTTYRLKQINADTVKPGSINCIFSAAFTPTNTAHMGHYWPINTSSDVARLARQDYEFYLRNLKNVGFTIGGQFLGPKEAKTRWTPPSDFGSHEAHQAYARTMSWNDDRGYDAEKRTMLKLAIEQELAFRKSRD